MYTIYVHALKAHDVPTDVFTLTGQPYFQLTEVGDVEKQENDKKHK